MELNIGKPLTLRCGLTLPNRLVKAAMAEGLADARHLPASQRCLDVYGGWAKGGWGLVITGNVQVDAAHLGDPGDIAIDSSLPEATTLAAFKAWAAACSGNGTKAVVQLCHPGRQIAFQRDKVAPSAIPMDFGPALVPRLLNALVFGTPRSMTADEVAATVRRFAEAARLVAAAGFAGVELHAAHGYLLAQFLSARSNARDDAYGGSALARARIVVDTVRAIRAVVPPSFCVGVKLNSVDVGSAADLGDCLEQVRAIADAGIDFLEISGGTFEDPVFSTGPGEGGEKRASTLAREAFFLEFARAMRGRFPDVPLVVTGGFRTRRGMEAALAEGSCDLIGLARPAIMDPLLPRTVLLNPAVPHDKAGIVVKRLPPGAIARFLGVKLIGVGPERDWYTRRMHRIGALKGTVVVAAAASGLRSAFVRELRSHSKAAGGYYGLYLADTAQPAGEIARALAKAEAAEHAHELLTLDLADPDSIRKVALDINRRVTLGSLPPIRALVLCVGAAEIQLGFGETTESGSADSGCASQSLLASLLVESMDKDSGRVVIFQTSRFGSGLNGFRPPGKHKRGVEHPSETDSLLYHHRKSWDEDSPDTREGCPRARQELGARLAAHPAFSGVPVAVIETDPRSKDSGILGRIMMWIVFTVAALLSMLSLPYSAADVRNTLAAREAVRVVLEQREDIHLRSAAMLSRSSAVCVDGSGR